ncbi:DinB family protein [Mucilaginibacter sp. UR6-11]|uniref:DinB family protein n=1 Tax=Mucilaginibacter sp. UR6-11 TaxID=1435644 RepID=UPI001E5515A4|nr:DinB family protein [Mucilaginibacter sp. UR6-11]MCC8427322.1 DinB family protein [Mucilaginibacter sp. UR6-11]
MSIIKLLLKEIEQEAQITRNMLSIVPNDKYNWQPHPKSMSIMKLTNHIAELPGWLTMAVTTDGLDFAANPYEPTFFNNTADVLEVFENQLTDGRANLEGMSEAELEKPWILRNGDHVLSSMTKYETIRLTIAQTIHHRAQLGVYLRLLNIPIPGSYGPSADDLEKMQQYA